MSSGLILAGAAQFTGYRGPRIARIKESRMWSWSVIAVKVAANSFGDGVDWLGSTTGDIYSFLHERAAFTG